MTLVCNLGSFFFLGVNLLLGFILCSFLWHPEHNDSKVSLSYSHGIRPSSYLVWWTCNLCDFFPHLTQEWLSLFLMKEALIFHLGSCNSLLYSFLFIHNKYLIDRLNIDLQSLHPLIRFWLGISQCPTFVSSYVQPVQMIHTQWPHYQPLCGI